MKYLFTTYCILFAAYFCKANDNDSLSLNAENNILFFKDPRVDVLQKIYSRKPAGPKKKLVRVQVFQATARDQVFDAKAKFSARFPGIATFITYASPNFKLRAGEFASKEEAFKFLMQMKSMFPASFVIEEKSDEEREDDKNKANTKNGTKGTKATTTKTATKPKPKTALKTN
ncbi:MAG: SPOR domain-containing protein [Chitinophagales bacterium]|jgi:hypothetical protein|nr:SPOR domain-containing protein [Saprospirales bacterium]MBP6659285.1 SPOR domain-containing protein [Chitinophagales bacterium]